MNDFHYALSLCQTLYGTDMKEEDFEEIAVVAWNLIGNKRTKIYRYTTCMDDCSDLSIDLPCNCDILEAVTASWEDWGAVTDTSTEIDRAFTEQYIERQKTFKDPLYESGKLVKYERVGNTLYFDKPYKKITILYKGLVLDDNGLPEITDKEALAIATYCAYITKYKEGLTTNNSGIINLADTLKKQWNVQCDQARTDQYLSQNDWNNILDAKTSWDRKVHSKSWKPYR